MEGGWGVFEGCSDIGGLLGCGKRNQIGMREIDFDCNWPKWFGFGEGNWIFNSSSLPCDTDRITMWISRISFLLQKIFPSSTPRNPETSHRLPTALQTLIHQNQNPNLIPLFKYSLAPKWKEKQRQHFSCHPIIQTALLVWNSITNLLLLLYYFFPVWSRFRAWSCTERLLKHF